MIEQPKVIDISVDVVSRVEPMQVNKRRAEAKPEPVLMPTLWPAAGHEHAVEAPSPQALIDEGHRILNRILTS